MSDEKREKILNLKDLTSQFALKEWIKNNIKDKNGKPYYDDSIPKIDMEKYLEFILNQVKDQRVLDKKDWIGQINKIKDRVLK
tara:strand:- start:1077 stop:1325 length:249 start_codon:yes stop_codon:yes gene_type:complete